MTRDELNQELTRALATPDNFAQIRNLRDQIRDLDMTAHVANLTDMAERAERRDQVADANERLQNLQIERQNLKGRPALSLTEQNRLNEVINEMTEILDEIDGLIEA